MINTRRLLPIIFAAIMLALAAPHLALAEQGKPTILESLSGGQKEESAKAEAKEANGKKHNDAYGRETPRDAVRGFLAAGRKGDFDKAAKYLALADIRPADGQTPAELAEKLYQVIRRGMWIDFDALSDSDKGFTDDGLASYQERIGFIDLPDGPFQVLLERGRNKQGAWIWLFSGSTAKAIPKLYANYGLGAFGEFLAGIFPRFSILGIELWEWAGMFLFGLFSYLAAWASLSLLKLIMAKRWARLKQDVQHVYGHPMRWLLAILIMRGMVDYMDISQEVKLLFSAKTFLIFVGAWVILSLISIAHSRLVKRLESRGHEETTILLRPLSTVIKLLVLILAFLLWLDNIGFNVTALLASLGVGGIAVAMAAQDTLKNFIGSMAVLLDKPYLVGERIRLKGHDGIVREIGLRSTRMLGVDGNEVTIPNETMARADIINVSRRPHIRRIFNVHVAYATPAEKLRRAVKALEGLLENHEGMDPELPPRVYLNEFGESTLNIEIWYWYTPPNFWLFKTFSQELNLRIKETLEGLGVEFAFPVRTLRLDGQAKPDRFEFVDFEAEPKK